MRTQKPVVTDADHEKDIAVPVVVRLEGASSACAQKQSFWIPKFRGGSTRPYIKDKNLLLYLGDRK
jgi:hypothetical protein